MRIDGANKFMVSSGGYGITIHNRPLVPMTPDEALLLAAWLVRVAETDATNTFAEVAEAVTEC